MGELITFRIAYNFEKMLIMEVKRKSIGAIATTIQIKKTFNKLTRNLATESKESNAPPCAPPSDLTEFARIKSILEAILPSILDQIIDSDETDNHLCSALKYQDVKEYIVYRLTKKVLDYPNLLNLDFKTTADFYEFEKNIRGEVFRLLLKIRKKAGKSAKQILKNANDAYNIKELSLDAPLTDSDDNDDKQRDLYDILPSASDEPLAFLIKIETEKEAEALISKLSQKEKEQLIADFNKKQAELDKKQSDKKQAEARKKGLLLYVESEYSRNQETIDINIFDIFKYRRVKQKTSSEPQQIDQPTLFNAGGDDNE